MELLDERWTMLVVRELLLGSRHFNDLRRGLPKMSPARLSKRLQTLTRAGVVERRDAGGRTTYSLTQSGRELADVVDALGTWGVRWIGELGDRDLDPHLLMWDMRRNVPVDEWPRARTVVNFRLSGAPPKASSWWLVVADGKADVCDFDPGFDPHGHRGYEPAQPRSDLARRRVMVTGTAKRVRHVARTGRRPASGAEMDRPVKAGGCVATGMTTHH